MQLRQFAFITNRFHSRSSDITRHRLAHSVLRLTAPKAKKKCIVYYETLMLSITSMAVTIATPRTTKKTYTGNKNQEIRAQENETSDKDRTSLHINTSSASFFSSSIFLLHSVAVEKEKPTKSRGLTPRGFRRQMTHRQTDRDIKKNVIIARLRVMKAVPGEQLWDRHSLI